MPGEYYCAHCEHEFVVEEREDGVDRPPCPRCSQTESVRLVDTGLVMDIRRQWIVVFAVLFIATAGFALYQLTRGG